MSKMDYRISIQRTEAEWDKIRSVIPNRDIGRYLMKEILRIERMYKENPHSITIAAGIKTAKSRRLHPETYRCMKEISRKMKRPISTIIDELVIAPILAKLQEPPVL